MSDTNWQLKETDPFAPSCGARPGDGGICKTACKVAEESPTVAEDAKQEGNTQDALNVQALLRLTAERISSAGPKTLAMHLNCAANHIEAQQQHIEALERELAEASKDAARLCWILPIIGGDDDVLANIKTMRLGGALMLGLSGIAAIDAAMKEQA